MRITRFNIGSAGDTLVEVMLATAILSLVLAGAFTISNRATRINQTASERTQVSNLMQREAELIRALKDTGEAALWTAVDSRNNGSENSSFCDGSGSNPRVGAFYVQDDLTIADISTDSNGNVQDNIPTDFFDIWVEAVNSSAPVTYTDFFVYGCWDAIGGEGFQRSGLVMRLER